MGPKSDKKKVKQNINTNEISLVMSQSREILHGQQSGYIDSNKNKTDFQNNVNTNLGPQSLRCQEFGQSYSALPT